MIIIETTSDSKKVLKRIAEKLINKKVTACVHITKIPYSCYVWNNKFVNKKEYKLEIKTIEDYEKTIFDIVKEEHNYKIFELSKKKLVNLNKAYLEWFKKQLD